MSDAGWGLSRSGLLVPHGSEEAAPQRKTQSRIRVRDAQLPPSNKNGRGVHEGMNNEEYIYEIREQLDCGSVVIEYKNGHMEPVGKPQFLIPDEAWENFKSFMDYQRDKNGRGAGSLTSFMADNNARMEYSMPEVFFRMWAAERGLIFEDVNIEEDLDMKKDLFAFWRKRYSGSSPFTTGKTQYD